MGSGPGGIRGDYNARSPTGRALDRSNDAASNGSCRRTNYVVAPCERDHVRVGLLLWHTVGVAMAHPIVPPWT